MPYGMATGVPVSVLSGTMPFGLVGGSPTLVVGVPVSGHVTSHMAGQTAATTAGPATRPLRGLLFAQLTGDAVPPGLEEVAQTALRRWDPETRKRILSSMEEFYKCMSKQWFGVAGCWKHARPEHVYLFLKEWAYSGGKTNVGRKCHQTVSSFLSYLRQLFRMWGRDLRWNPETGLGNPVDSYEVECFASGFGKENRDKGVTTQGATPWGFEKLCPLFQHLDGETLPAFNQRILLRDIAVLNLAALTGKRGQDVGHAYVGDLISAAGVPVDPREFHPAQGEGFVLTLYSKTRVIEPGPPVYFSYSSLVGERETNFLWRLEQYWASLPPTHKLGRYMFGDRRGQPLSRGALNLRLEGYFSKYKLGPPLKVHGLRRGLIQSLEEAGFTQSEIMAHLDIRSNHAYQLYADQYRHLPPDHPDRLAAIQFKRGGNMQRG